MLSLEKKFRLSKFQ